MKSNSQMTPASRIGHGESSRSSQVSQHGGDFWGQYSPAMDRSNTRRTGHKTLDRFADTRSPIFHDTQVHMHTDDGRGKKSKPIYHKHNSCGPIHADCGADCRDDHDTRPCFRSGVVSCDGDAIDANKSKLERYHHCIQQRSAYLEKCKQCRPGGPDIANGRICSPSARFFCSTYDIGTHENELANARTRFQNCKEQLANTITARTEAINDVVDGSYVFILQDRHRSDYFCTIPFLAEGSPFPFILKKMQLNLSVNDELFLKELVLNNKVKLREQNAEGEVNVGNSMQIGQVVTADAHRGLEQLLNNMRLAVELSDLPNNLPNSVENRRVYADAVNVMLTTRTYQNWINTQIPILDQLQVSYAATRGAAGQIVGSHQATFVNTHFFGVDEYGTLHHLDDRNYGQA